MFYLGWVNWVLYWVVSYFLARLFLRNHHTYNRKTLPYHRSRQLLLQGHGSGNLSIDVFQKQKAVINNIISIPVGRPVTNRCVQCWTLCLIPSNVDPEPNHDQFYSIIQLFSARISVPYNCILNVYLHNKYSLSFSICFVFNMHAIIYPVELAMERKTSYT